jgi:hypothetical protein
MTKDELIKLAQGGMDIHSPNNPEYIVCAALIEVLTQQERKWRPWEGLSADEISDLIPNTDLSGDYGYGDMFAVARLVEYKLREKNEKTN